MSYLSLSDVSKRYQTGTICVDALKHISFELDDGEFVVILGSSGAGKTTLLNLLGGMDSATEGEIVVERNGKRYSIVYRFVDDNEARPHTIAGSYAGTVEFTNLVRDAGSSPL